MAWPGDQHWSIARQWPWLVLFIGVYVLLVVLMGTWSRMLARRVATSNFHRSLRRFNQTMFVARLIVPIWFAVGVWVLGWGPLIAGEIGQDLARSVAGVIIGTFPAFAAWVGLWWSQYPADRALREQSLLLDWENELPLHRPPPFRSYFSANLRLQVLFTVVPVLMIVGVRDLMMRAPHWLGAAPGPDGRVEPVVELSSSIFAAAVVFLFAPEILRRVLSTTPLPDGPLRQRLEVLCRRAGIKYRQILLWKTENNVGNAAVMGILPFMRYVLLSDLLLERMTDEQIEAVFAHELGHIVHRHMAWYGIFFVALLLLILPLQKAVDLLLPGLGGNASSAWLLLIVFGAAGFFLLLFGALSRRCERQADVYAARTMETIKTAAATQLADPLLNASQLAMVGVPQQPIFAYQSPTYVGPQGAKLFASALRRVAAINNIPITERPAAIDRSSARVQFNALVDAVVDMANHWFHGSITGRMEYLEQLSSDPTLTHRFDRTMSAVYVALLLLLFTSVIMTLGVCLM
jgi:STE24 endopeptidase